LVCDKVFAHCTRDGSGVSDGRVRPRGHRKIKSYFCHCHYYYYYYYYFDVFALRAQTYGQRLTYNIVMRAHDDKNKILIIVIVRKSVHFEWTSVNDVEYVQDDRLNVKRWILVFILRRNHNQYSYFYPRLFWLWFIGYHCCIFLNFKGE